jgi:hypothetical protein
MMSAARITKKRFDLSCFVHLAYGELRAFPYLVKVVRERRRRRRRGNPKPVP